MKKRHLNALALGLTATFASVMVISITGASIANSFRTNIDAMFGTKSYEIVEGADSARFNKKYTTVDEMITAARNVAIKEGQEGTVVMKNDNSVLPLAANGKVALFGIGAYATFPYLSGDLRAGNADAVDLKTAFTNAGFTVDAKVAEVYEKITNKHIETVVNPWTGEESQAVAYSVAPAVSPGDMVQFTNNEIPAGKLAEKAEVSADWVNAIDHSATAFVVISRGAGEGNTYSPTLKAKDYAGNDTNRTALQLSEDELGIIELAKSSCSKVVVLINSGNNLELGEISKGGTHEVDGIAYIGCINDYQLTGVVDVLSGKVNANGKLADTFVYDNLSVPASRNIGGGIFKDYQIVAANSANGFDSRWPNVDIETGVYSSFASRVSYSSDSYIVEAEGIYVGYKYFETRYYDSIMNPSFKADDPAGSRDGNAWKYDNEVLYTFGSGLSYLEYDQELTDINIDKSAEGNITAQVKITNKGDKAGLFTAQLYAQQPYTQHDKDANVEKSAVSFLNSAKVLVDANASKTVTITVPTKYLASYDASEGVKTYSLEQGDYYFTAANGAHEAVNSFIKAQGKTPTVGTGENTVKSWNSATDDITTFSKGYNGYGITNQVDNADINYWLPGAVTYMTRKDWSTFPKDYTLDANAFTIANSAKKDEWIKEFRGQQYKIQTDKPATEGKDLGMKFGVDSAIGDDVLANINDDYWSKLVSQITIDEALGAVLHGGSQTDVLTNVDNPNVSQNEGVSGFTAVLFLEDGCTYKEQTGSPVYKFNVHSQTLLATSFDPELALEWGEVEGNSGLWLQRYDLWGTGLTQRRTPYNGRNYEYISEDSMLANRLGAKILRGCANYGIINGPKHLGANDQEFKRAGLNEFMTEQKLREGDLRCFQAALEPKDGGGLAVMIAFNRIGSTSACQNVGVCANILRNEWGFTGIISTDMATNSYYFIAEAMVMATVTQVADFQTGDNHINAGTGGVDAVWPYISVDSVKNDATLVEQARQNLKYQLFTFANSAVFNTKTIKLTPWWESSIKALTVVSAVLAGMGAIISIGLTFVPAKKED